MGLLDWISGGAKKYGLTQEELKTIIIQADRENPSAKQALSSLFEQGLTSDEHNELRLSIYRPLAEQGDSTAQWWMGLLTNHDPGQSCHWYEKAAAQGDVDAMRALAMGYSEFANDDSSPSTYPGFGFHPELELAWLLKAAELGDPKSQCDLAFKYIYGDNVEKDIDQAIYWYMEAGNQNYASAFLELGKLYKCPEKTNLQLSLHFFLAAAQSKNREIVADAAHEIGVHYGACYIFGAPPLDYSNPHKALYWLSQAYILGDNPYTKEYMDKLCAATGLQISEDIWAQWVEEAKQRVSS